VRIVRIVRMVFRKVRIGERIGKVSENPAHCAHYAHSSFRPVGAVWRPQDAVSGCSGRRGHLAGEKRRRDSG